MQICAFLRPILAGQTHRNAQKNAETRKMHKNTPFCTDACNTPVHYTPVSVHPNFWRFFVHFSTVFRHSLFSGLSNELPVTSPNPFKRRTERKHDRVGRPHSTYQKVVQGKCPLHFVLFNGVFCSNALFSNTSALTTVIQGKFYMQRFSNTSFGQTLLGSNFGGLFLKQTFCRHFS